MNAGQGYVVLTGCDGVVWQIGNNISVETAASNFRLNEKLFTPYPEDGGSTFLQEVGYDLPDYTISRHTHCGDDLKYNVAHRLKTTHRPQISVTAPEREWIFVVE